MLEQKLALNNPWRQTFRRYTELTILWLISFHLSLFILCSKCFSRPIIAHPLLYRLDILGSVFSWVVPRCHYIVLESMYRQFSFGIVTFLDSAVYRYE